MSATDELRAELTKRGVEYEVDDGKTVRVTRWKAYGEWVSFIEYDTGETRFCTDMRRFTPAQAIEATLGAQITEDTSDGWHSFKDLYHHRALLFSVIVHNYKDMCWKSKRHHDGKELDWNFIVGIDTPWGQASYHYGMDYWNMFDCKVLERAPYYDGYTADESVARIAKLVELEPSTLGTGTCRFKTVIDQDPSRRHRGNICECDGCGYRCARGFIEDERFKHCPNCGRKVVDE